MIYKLSNKIKSYWILNDSYFSIKSIQKFYDYFFLDLNIKISDNSYLLNYSKIYDIQDDVENNNLNQINILLCVENCNYWKHYNHYNKYGDYLDPNLNIYFYNHIDKIYETENLIAIPIIYVQINYFKKFYDIIKPNIFIPFENKKFCLIATNLNNPNKQNIYNILSSINKCDFIHEFKDVIGNKSCYHDVELLNLFNQYKFVFVAENSIDDGYITEKIFNCFFARCIPIYFGSNKIKYYFNDECFVDTNEINLSKISVSINYFNNIEIYKIVINKNKININYNDENYVIKFNAFIKKIKFIEK